MLEMEVGNQISNRTQGSMILNESDGKVKDNEPNENEEVLIY